MSTNKQTKVKVQGTLNYATANKVLDEATGKTPRAWSMHPYAGGYITALSNLGIITKSVAKKLWAEYANGI